MAITPTTHGGQGRGFGLVLKPSTISTAGSAQGQDITDLARNWSRSIRLQGGYWTGSFSMPLSKRAFGAFETWLGCHVEERAGGLISWEGLVYEMELVYRGVVYRRSLDSMWNRVRVHYTDAAGVETDTAWAQIDSSVARYGQKETTLESDTRMPNEAEAYRDAYLAEYGWPWHRAVQMAAVKDDGLTVTCCGYSFTANWRYASATVYDVYSRDGVSGFDANWHTSPGANQQVKCTPPFTFAAYEAVAAPAIASVYIMDNAGNTYWAYIGEFEALDPDIPNAICVYRDQALTIRGFNPAPPPPPGLSNTRWLHTGISDLVNDLMPDMPYLNEGGIAGNYGQVDRGTTGDATLVPSTYVANAAPRVWDWLMAANSTGDQNGDLWRLYMLPNRLLMFEEVDPTPRWFYVNGVWCIDPGGSPANPWQLTPAVCRAMDWRHAPRRDGYWLADPRDFLVEEFQVDASGTVTPQLAEVSQSEMLVYRLNQMWAGVEMGNPLIQREHYPPNWDVEHNRPNPAGIDPDTGQPVYGYGYWYPDPDSPTGYTYNPDPNLRWDSYYDPVTGQVVKLP